MALSKPFFNSEKLFSLMFDGYETQLKEEIWRAHKYMNLTMHEIYDMTVADRRAYIQLHNKLTNEENEQYKSARKK